MTAPAPPSRGHYSYDLYRRVDIAQGFDADRFGGPVGAWLARIHHELLLNLLGPVEGWQVLDVGGGTGRLVEPLRAAGATVQVSDASAQMLAVAREKMGASAPPLWQADIHALLFRDRAFDGVVSSRVLMHVLDWRRSLAELTRVSRRSLVIDFPPASATTLLAPVVLPLKRLLEPDTQVYQVLRVREVVRELERLGFQVTRQERQLALPFFVHRKLKRPDLSARIEGRLARWGITRRIGAPVVLRADRRGA